MFNTLFCAWEEPCSHSVLPFHALRSFLIQSLLSMFSHSLSISLPPHCIRTAPLPLISNSAAWFFPSCLWLCWGNGQPPLFISSLHSTAVGCYLWLAPMQIWRVLVITLAQKSRCVFKSCLCTVVAGKSQRHRWWWILLRWAPSKCWPTGYLLACLHSSLPLLTAKIWSGQLSFSNFSWL